MNELLISTRELESRAQKVFTFEDRPPAEKLPYEFHAPRGKGASEKEAVNDWVRHLPSGPFAMIIWRAKPELVSERDYETKEMKYAVHSRLAIVPIEDCKAA